MKYKITARKKDFSTMILYCCSCHHEIETARYEGQKCDWCGGDMVIIGKGTTWPSMEEYKVIARQLKDSQEEK